MRLVANLQNARAAFEKCRRRNPKRDAARVQLFVSRMG